MQSTFDFWLSPEEMTFSREILRKFDESIPREAQNVIQFKPSFGPEELVTLVKTSRHVYLLNGVMAKTDEDSSEIWHLVPVTINPHSITNLKVEIC